MKRLGDTETYTLQSHSYVYTYIRYTFYKIVMSMQTYINTPFCNKHQKYKHKRFSCCYGAARMLYIYYTHTLIATNSGYVRAWIHYKTGGKNYNAHIQVEKKKEFIVVQKIRNHQVSLMKNKIKTQPVRGSLLKLKFFFRQFVNVKQHQCKPLLLRYWNTVEYENKNVI